MLNRENWIRCPKCGHKLFKAFDMKTGDNAKIEIKCHSCKTIILVALKIKEDIDERD